MSVKRSRQSESSSFTERDASNLMSSVEPAKEVPGVASSSSEVMEPPLKCLKPTIDESKKGNLWSDSVLNPARGAKKVRGFGEFPKLCHYCAKEIDLQNDIYMFREWCAFCSVECRDHQIKMDDKFQKECEESLKEELSRFMK